VTALLPCATVPKCRLKNPILENGQGSLMCDLVRSNLLNLSPVGLKVLRPESKRGAVRPTKE